MSVDQIQPNVAAMREKILSMQNWFGTLRDMNPLIQNHPDIKNAVDALYRARQALERLM